MAQSRPHGGRPEGIVPRHLRRCASQAGGRCNCQPSYQAQVWSARDHKPIRKTFRTLADARTWRAGEVRPEPRRDARPDPHDGP
jgi:hypothetical protein